MSNTIEELKRLNIISTGKLINIFQNYYQDVLSIPINRPSKFIESLWQRYKKEDNSLNGKVFESLISCCLYRLRVTPLFAQVKLAFIPNVSFDFVLYTKELGPIVLSAKTSLRERYKQADLEGIMLRQVHRKSRSYLLTLNKEEALNVNNKIERGEVLGIDKVILASCNQFDDLIEDLKSKYSFYTPPPIKILTSNKIIDHDH